MSCIDLTIKMSPVNTLTRFQIIQEILLNLNYFKGFPWVSYETFEYNTYSKLGKSVHQAELKGLAR